MKLSRRHTTTLCYLLRGYAQQQRRMHGPGIERPGALELTPTEMEEWADEIDPLRDPNSDLTE